VVRRTTGVRRSSAHGGDVAALLTMIVVSAIGIILTVKNFLIE